MIGLALTPQTGTARSEVTAPYTDVADAYAQGRLPEARRLAVMYLERAKDGLARASGPASQEGTLPGIVNLIRFAMCGEGTLDAVQRTAEVIARAEALLLDARRIDDANSGVTGTLAVLDHRYVEDFIGEAAELWLVAANGVVAPDRRQALFDRLASDLRKRGVTNLEQIPGRYVDAALALPQGQRAVSAGEKLAAGERIVEDYSSEDVVPTSEAEFNRGVALIEEALREHVKDRRRALLALVNAGRLGPNGPNPTPKRLSEVFRELLSGYPRDPEVLMKYAAHLRSTDPKAALPAYLHVLEVQPDNAEALFLVAGCHLDAGEVAAAVEEMVRAVRLKSADPDMIQSFVPGFVNDLNALGNSRFVPAVSAAVFEALAAQARGGNTKAAFVSAALHVEFGQAKTGVEEFLSLLHQDSVDESMIREGLERITRYLRADEHENVQYIERVTAAAAGKMEGPTKGER